MIPQKIHLARLEEQLTVFLKQRDRAEERIDRIHARPEGYDDVELMKAELFANRVQQQCVKLIKDIEKDRQALQKAAAEPVAVAAPISSPAPATTTLFSNTPSEAKSQSMTSKSILEQVAFNPLAAGAAEIPLTPPATTDEYLNCLVSNRHCLKNTSAKGRQAFLARLIREHRAKTTARAA